MTWVALDDKMPEHPKVICLSDGAFRLYLSAIAYSNRNLTDGIIGAGAVSGLMPRYRTAYLNELVERKLWVKITADQYEIHDYLDWNKSRAEVEDHQTRVSRARSEAGKKGAASRWGGGRDR
jgi:hypothetical protein